MNEQAPQVVSVRGDTARTRSRGPRHRRPRPRAVWLAVPLMIVPTAMVVSSPAAGAAPTNVKPTVISLTFDDSNADQLIAAKTMRQLRMPGTFYTVPSVIGTPGYMTIDDLRQLHRDGSEIGGHTVNHPDLTAVSSDEATRQVCQARNTLSGWGFPQISFAYPYATLTSDTESIVRDCGYNSARGLGDVRSRFGCQDCDAAESIPPADPYSLAALDQVDSTWTLTDLTNAVTAAERTGGWLIFTFHHICAGQTCDPLSISPGTFERFATWLAAHRLLRPTTTVKTVGQVVGGTVRPPIEPPAAPATAGALANSSFETRSGDDAACWTPYSWGRNDAAFSLTADAHTGSSAAQVTMANHANGAVGIYPTFDTGGCTPAAAPDHTYTVSAWYKSTSTVQFVAYVRNSRGGFEYLTSGPYLSPSSTWAKATWATPQLPTGTSGISVGLSLFGDGTLIMDDITVIDSATLPPQTIPTAMGNPSLEDAGINGIPECWTPSIFGTNTATFQTTSPGHSGATAMTVSISDYTDGAAQLLTSMYGSPCSPDATPGHRYELSAWYQADTITQFIVHYLTEDGQWQYWTASPWLPSTSAWAEATWTTPALPPGAVRIAFGLSLFTVGTLTSDDYGFVDAT